MGLEQQKQQTLRSAEGLLRQGKVQEALVVLERMAASSSSDQLTLNRMGDLLARFGHNDEAIGYYFRIAVEFADSGFYPKAVAIHKKILRLNPDNIASLVHLGELQLERSLAADARAHLLHAAELQLQTGNFDAARGIYQKLVEAEPEDARHRVRLAEAIAAAGDSDKAGDELILLGQSLLKAGNCPDAERSYRRAAELLPGRSEAILGICDSLVGQGQDHEALEMLEQAAGKDGASPEIRGALALRYESSGKQERALELLKEISVDDIPPAVLQSMFRINQEQDCLDACWERFDPLLAEWSEQGKSDKLAETYRLISLIEKPGHLPAIQRWCDLMKEAGDNEGEARALEAQALAFQARSMASEAEEALERLAKIAPDSAMFGLPKNEKSKTSAAAAKEKPKAEESEKEPSQDIETPAVPVNRGEEEFAAGRLTQAEILDKYGLHDQALQQVREVIERFPGSVEAQEKLVLFLRTTNDSEQLRDALIGLAMARKAVGALDEAREAAAEARRNGPIDDSKMEQLNKLGLLQEPEPAKAEPKIEQPRAATPQEPADDKVVLIDFDDVEEDEADQEETTDVELPLPIPPTAPPVAASPVELPATPVPAAAAPEPAHESEQEPEAAQQQAVATESSDMLGDDLSAITAALESDVFAEETQNGAAGSEPEQSLDEVFATFRKQVEKEVDSDDFRTHYDLGIAYKEMGFIDEAIAEFEQSAGSPDLGREVSIMLAMCHRDKGDNNRAVACYRQAIELPGAEPAAMNGLRYELAELLLDTGDSAGALQLFRSVQQDDSSFRDVGERVQLLEAEAAG